MRKALNIIVPILICFLVGMTASYFQADAIQTWYPTLNKPILTPPNIIFPIAWSIIYLLMGASIGLVLNSSTPEKRKIGILFILQLLFNFSWSFSFFYLQNPLLGLINILILDILVLMYIIKTYKAFKVSSYLFLPYIIWIAFATYLNGYIWLAN
ncbi:TspO/MBR family protein [Bacteroides propionicifaciens]|jgi:translocator protein|uniref:TspO/MBR family protein n=1 Tax=Bacteroides propionicifaciens TaxID=392838 RepID=UPI0003770131|nr:TspO/MBR family protein [Bacteroides propionicifaciens]